LTEGNTAERKAPRERWKKWESINQKGKETNEIEREQTKRPGGR
jgi:hypothetical protein